MSADQIKHTDTYKRILACCTCAPGVDREQHALTIARDVLRLRDPSKVTS